MPHIYNCCPQPASTRTTLQWLQRYFRWKFWAERSRFGLVAYMLGLPKKKFKPTTYGYSLIWIQFFWLAQSLQRGIVALIIGVLVFSQSRQLIARQLGTRPGPKSRGEEMLADRPEILPIFHDKAVSLAPSSLPFLPETRPDAPPLTAPRRPSPPNPASQPSTVAPYTGSLRIPAPPMPNLR
jgi:hypothetical protein